MEAAKYAAGEVFCTGACRDLPHSRSFLSASLFYLRYYCKFMSHLPVTLIITLGASAFVAFVMNWFLPCFGERDEPGESLGKLPQGIIFFIALCFCWLFQYGNGLWKFFSCILLILLYHFIFPN